MKKILGLFLLVLFLSAAKAASAAETQFPNCSGYSGDNIQANYDSGLHAIVGDSNNESGADTVYSLDKGNFMQCFCPETNNGIQTNWLSTSGMSEDEIQSNINNGWTLIEHGQDWGLEQHSYLAQNSNFTCGGNPGNTGGTGGPAEDSPSSSSCGDTAPQAAILTNVQKLNPTEVELTWSPVSGASNYTIVYGLSAGNYQYGVPSTGNVTKYDISQLDANAKYYFAVRAVNGCASADPSNEVTSPDGQVLGASSLADTASTTGQIEIASAAVFGMFLASYGKSLKNYK